MRLRPNHLPKLRASLRFESAGESACGRGLTPSTAHAARSRAGIPQLALAALARHDRLTQKKLGAEATLLRVRALVAAGRAAEAQRIARETLAARGADGHVGWRSSLGSPMRPCSER
ncbi:MAG: hypothetical protein U0263_13445 [Polyangiaceae bacterium]